MTKKRFELVYEDYDSFAIRDNDYIQENKHYRTLEEIVALLNQLNTNSKKLNELHEKNQRLKSILQSERRELIEQNNNYRKLLNELKEENEQLKLKNKELQSELDIRKEDINHSNKVFMKLCDKNNELKEENLQLKDIVKDIMIELNANHTMNTYQITIPINKVIYNELNRRLEETSFNGELRRRFLK